VILHDLLFELGTEELPSGSVKLLSDALAKGVVAGLLKATIGHGHVRAYATPRRLAVFIEKVETMQVSQHISRRGPAVSSSQTIDGQPLPALIGFAKSCGVHLDELSTVKTDKGEWWAYESESPGVSTSELLPAIITDALASLPIAKPMRWGSSDLAFARPVHWALLLFHDAVVHAEILGVVTGRQSFGHRFHHPQAIEIATPKDYEVRLQDAFVIADFAVRRDLIAQQVQQLAAQHTLNAVMPDALLDEVTSIVEWPQALFASFDDSFLEVPQEALIAAMQVHQKCFALQTEQGDLSPHFITISNISSKNPAEVIAGNEKVMRARLSDAAFFYNQDKKRPLSDYSLATKKVVFQIKLGSIWDKTTRMALMMRSLISLLELPPIEAERAASLSKCDLLTGMVGEFPELQGVMGYYYATHDNEKAEVAVALKEHYLPRFATDELPQANLSKALSLVDRLDTMVGLFAIGQKPTGVKDPFKLRRHALAVVRLLVSIEAPVSLSMLINEMRHIYGEKLPACDTQMLELRTFILERMHSFYQTQGVASEWVHAVRQRQDDWLFDIDKRVKALQVFVGQPEALALSATSKRVTNLLQHAVHSDELQTVDVSLLQEASERALFERIEAVEALVAPRYAMGDYGFILSQLANLRDPVDAFFENVLVMADDTDIKKNRLCLVARLQALLQGVADISLIS